MERFRDRRTRRGRWACTAAGRGDRGCAHPRDRQLPRTRRSRLARATVLVGQLGCRAGPTSAMQLLLAPPSSSRSSCGACSPMGWMGGGDVKTDRRALAVAAARAGSSTCSWSWRSLGGAVTAAHGDRPAPIRRAFRRDRGALRRRHRGRRAARAAGHPAEPRSCAGCGPSGANPILTTPLQMITAGCNHRRTIEKGPMRHG
jgi:hypothetical protein